MREMTARTSKGTRASAGTRPSSSDWSKTGSSQPSGSALLAWTAAEARSEPRFDTMDRVMASAWRSSLARWSTTPDCLACTSPPPRSSALTTSPVAALTSGGPPRKIVPVPRTMTVSSDMAGTYAPPAVQLPITTAICGMPCADMLAWLKKMRPKCSLSGNTSACSGRNAPPESTK